jgi:hypothetical protein
MCNKCHWTTCSIFQDKGGKTILLQPNCYIVSFRIDIMPEVTSTGTYDNGGIIVAWHKIWGHFNLGMMGCTIPNIDNTMSS